MKRALNEVALVDLRRAIDIETDITVASFLDPDTTARIARILKALTASQ